MFYFATTTGQIGACSEAKGLIDITKGQNGVQQFFEPFPPAHYNVYDVSKDGKLSLETKKQFHSFVDDPLHWKYQRIQLEKGFDCETVKKNIRTLFCSAVKKRLMSSRKLGSLLSGGLDSSLVAAIAAGEIKKENSSLKLPTFSIGMGQSPDVIAARKVAAHIGSEHHEVTITEDEGLQAVDDVIYALESYDVTTVRASTPMYLLAKYISNETDTIVIMSGEGADELAQGYIYFHKQPSPEEGDKESKRLLTDLYMYDVLRTDRSTASHGLEVRAPFLDHAFTSYFLSLPADMRMPKDGMEKHLVRSAFDGTGLLPNEILWRSKEAFSDGVSSRKKSWYEILQDHIEDKVTDEQMENAAQTFPHNTPRSKEAYYYRSVFENRFGSKLAKLIPYQWMPKWIECDDPSARVLSHYKNDEEAK
uniref:Asparagine synthetase [glutamine-hydrolyzing] n=1 Tax=Phallusia mammillata TaxID=59560 RepID=A0A6F9D6E7_9ASCI|nr:asparagine synthetase [glutamine-hydrolyzing] [Phallusia mammillata]